MASIWGAKATFFVCERWAPSLSPGECVCVVVTMNYGSPWNGGLWIMLMKSATITQTRFDRPSQSPLLFLARQDYVLKKCLKFH